MTREPRQSLSRLLLSIAILLWAASAHAGATARFELGGGVQHVDAPAEAGSIGVGLGVATIEGDYVLPSAPAATAPDDSQPTPWQSSVRGTLVGTGLLTLDHLRGRLDGRLLAELGYAVVTLQLSYGRMAAFGDRYWWSGRERWLPGLGIGGRGFRWRYSPSDLRIASWLAEAETQLASGSDGPAWDAKQSTNLAATLGLVTLERIKDERELRLEAFVGNVRHYGTGRLLDFSIDVLRFRSQPRSVGWGGYAAAGMSALRLTPGSRSVGPDTPGQATPAARAGLRYDGPTMAELMVATFHRIDPTGAAIDRGGRGEARVRARLGQRWTVDGSADLIVARRVRVGDQLAPEAPQYHDWLALYRVQSAIQCELGGGFSLVWRGWVERSDRDDSLRFASAPIQPRLLLGTELGLAWQLPTRPRN
jgi:hypothetical protein